MKNYFILIPGAVLENDNIPDGAKILYGMILSLANGTSDGRCFARNSYLAKNLHTTERTAQNYLEALRNEGFIETELVNCGWKGRFIRPLALPMAAQQKEGE